jgi:hypothetical protein
MLESWHQPQEPADSPQLDRRAVLTVSAGLVMAAAASARDAIEPVSQGGLFGSDAAATVILKDRRVALPDDLRSRVMGSGVQVLQLEADPVRMWRGEHAVLLGAASTRLLGITPWIEFVMIQGLAAESRRRVRYQRHDAGADAIVWLIA